ncbi:hypothetical protein ACH4E7_31835 [Kitasatospora sp. NPDC018058]|uniref:hypothetical protein n=1 Tax=Kitasatospora sp. NPDC018058 TaxID=3364025 RepID=UPI0037BE85CC
MYGGETALRLLFDHLLFVERQPEAFARQQRAWKGRGVWTATGVAGVFQDLLPEHDDEHDTASVYAEFAQQRGWLKPDSVLAEDAYAALTGCVRQWATVDRTWADVTSEFGPPSVTFGGNNPLYGKALGYLGEDPQQPMVVFHLWNGSDPGAVSWPPEHEQPLLLAVRFGTGSFRRSFTFTPEGERRKPTTADPRLSQ